MIAALLDAGDEGAEEAPRQGGKQGSAIPLRAYFQTLFGYATGWLGWTPAEAWAASPAEIAAAFTAHVDRLVTMTPGASRDDKCQPSSTNTYTAERLREIEEQGFDPAFDRQGMDRLKAMS